MDRRHAWRVWPRRRHHWNVYVIGVYSTFQYGWIVALSAIAIRRIQRIPVWAAILTSLVGFAVYIMIASVFVR